MGEAAASQTAAHSAVAVVVAHALACAVVAQAAIAVRMVVAAVHALALMDNHNWYTGQKTVRYFDLCAVFIALQGAALLAVRIASQSQWRDMHYHHPLLSGASPDHPATIA